MGGGITIFQETPHIDAMNKLTILRLSKVSYANVCVVFLKRSCKDPGKKQSPKADEYDPQSADTHPFLQKKESNAA